MNRLLFQSRRGHFSTIAGTTFSSKSSRYLSFLIFSSCHTIPPRQQGNFLHCLLQLCPIPHLLPSSVVLLRLKEWSIRQNICWGKWCICDFLIDFPPEPAHSTLVNGKHVCRRFQNSSLQYPIFHMTVEGAIGRLSTTSCHFLPLLFFWHWSSMVKNWVCVDQPREPESQSSHFFLSTCFLQIPLSRAHVSPYITYIDL